MDTELMKVADIINAIGLSGILFYFLSPTIVILLIAYNIKRAKDRNKVKKVENKVQQEIKEDALEGVELDKIDYTKFDTLELEFDKSGKVKSK